MRKFRSTFFTAPSKIHGKGCFTSIDLEPGMCFPVPNYMLPGDWDADEYTLWFEDFDEHGDYTVDPQGPFRFCNHHKKPRAEFYWDEDSGLMLHILRWTKAGKEITIHYGDEW